MSTKNLRIPSFYFSKLDIMETEIAIKLVKDTFERELARVLQLTRVSAPLFVSPESGLNDNLNGVERPVAFDVPDLDKNAEIVQSLAKWKRSALGRYGFSPRTGLYTDMNAIRRDEEMDNLHSIYVDQWDWERVITREERSEITLRWAASEIMESLRYTQNVVCSQFNVLERFLPEKLTFLTSQELEDKYPDLTPKQRENTAAQEFGAIFIQNIGGKLKSGKPHDGRAPDYDDWSLNGDILVWYPVLGEAVELSSMGIRVDAASLRSQLELSGCRDRETFPFHQGVLNDTLPLTMGGGIGQSRMCMVLLQKAHIGQVHASLWPEDMQDACAANGIHLL